MLKQLYKYWRVIGTGFSFAIFGVGGVIIALLVTLAVALHILPKSRRSSRARRIISGAFLCYIRFMRAIGLLTYEVQGQEYLKAEGPQLLIANHPSLLDVVFVIAHLRQVNCVVKEALWKNPFTRPPIKAANYISNDTQIIETGCRNLQVGEKLIVFPEGTRSKPGQPLNFHRGAANIAIQAGVPITPILITCVPPTLLKGQKWYQVPDTPPHFTIRFLPEIDTVAIIDAADMQSRNARKLTSFLQDYYSKLLQEAVADS